MPNPSSLLIVDDEPELVEILLEYFTAQGFAVQGAGDAAIARTAIQQQAPDLAILDVRMPGEDGLSLARWISETYPAVGIIMLTTAAEVVDRIIGLEMGADDYLPKPFELRELQARINSVLRRRSAPREVLSAAASSTTGEVRIAFGTCTLDLQTQQLFAADGSELPLTAMEFDLLKVFAEHPNTILNRDQLMELAHHRGWDVFDRSIDLRIMRLRRKIELNPEKPEVIKTIRGAGYLYVRQ